MLEGCPRQYPARSGCGARAGQLSRAWVCTLFHARARRVRPLAPGRANATLGAMNAANANRCLKCGKGCEGGAFIYRDVDGRSVFTGIVRKTKPDGSFAYLKLHDAYGDADGPAVELDPNAFMVDMTQYDHCSWPPAPNRTDSLVRMDRCDCPDPEACRRGFLPYGEGFDEAFPFSTDENGRWHVRVRPGDSVKLVTNVPHPTVRENGRPVPIRERFWAKVLAVHTLGLNELEPRITAMPNIDKWFHIKKRRWNPKEPLVCGVSCVAAVAHGPNW